MDPIIGDFTLTSKTTKNPPSEEYENPAIISTTFPRAIKQNEGYEIALKSIAHAPVKNLVLNQFHLITYRYDDGMIGNRTSTFQLTNRFYESQSDILMEIYRILSSLDDPPDMLLYEKDEETILNFIDNTAPGGQFDVQHELYFRTDLFLNRPFKYNTYSSSTYRKKRSLKRLKNDSVLTKLSDLQRAVKDLDEEWKPHRAFFELLADANVDPTRMANSYLVWQRQYQMLENFKTDRKQLIEQLNDHIEPKQEAEAWNAIKEDLDVKIKDNLEAISSFRTEVEKVAALDRANNDLQNICKKLQDNIDEIKEMVDDLNVRDFVLNRLEGKIDRNGRAIVKGFSDLNKSLGQDTSRIIMHDTSNFVSTKDKVFVGAKEISVSKKVIVTTRLGFLYCNVVENSLINNKESRLLCIFPIVSKRGYSFYEVKEAIYKPISVLQFSTITFTILDSEGDLVEFSLEGDQLTNKGDDKKKYPTLLNLHIRQRAINRSS